MPLVFNRVSFFGNQQKPLIEPRLCHSLVPYLFMEAFPFPPLNVSLVLFIFKVQTDVMRLVTQEKALSEEEYISFELQSEIRHEYVNGKLIDMSGESDLNNQLAFNCCLLLKMLLKNRGYNFFMEGVKVKVPGEKKYYYPDVFITKEPLSKGTVYIKENPELIVEILSDSTRKYDTVDKFINYQKFNSLQYYLLVEPGSTFISVFSRSENEDWNLDTYSKPEDTIQLPALGISFTVEEVYSL